MFFRVILPAFLSLARAPQQGPGFDGDFLRLGKGAKSEDVQGKK